MNLAFVDFINFALHIIIEWCQLVLKHQIELSSKPTTAIWGYTGSQAIFNIQYGIAYSDWMSVAMIALSRLMEVTNPRISKTIFNSNKNQIFIIISTWIYGFLLLLPSNFGVSFHH